MNRGRRVDSAKLLGVDGGIHHSAISKRQVTHSVLNPRHYMVVRIYHVFKTALIPPAYIEIIIRSLKCGSVIKTICINLRICVVAAHCSIKNLGGEAGRNLEDVACIDRARECHKVVVEEKLSREHFLAVIVVARSIVNPCVGYCAAVVQGILKRVTLAEVSLDFSGGARTVPNTDFVHIALKELAHIVEGL